LIAIDVRSCAPVGDWRDPNLSKERAELSWHAAEWDKAINWGGWIIVNAAVLPIAPAVGMKWMERRNKRTKGSDQATAFRVSYFAPYREGQLGYITLGYFAGAAVELIRAFEKVSDPIQAAGLVVSFLASLWLAGWGASTAAEGGSMTYSDAASQAAQDNWKTNQIFKSSVTTLIMELLLTGFVHLKWGG
jgi:hypothetical protein